MRNNHTGPDFREFIAKAISLRNVRSYLEIGVRDGATLQGVNCPSIGVDPQFAIPSFDFAKKSEVHFYQMTSDVFFRNHDPRRIVERPIDLVFIDGLHLFEFALRDFINSERICEQGSLILIDDCLPLNSEMTERYHNPAERSEVARAGWWTGDVWKIVPLLRKYRPDLRIVATDTQPTGMICVSGLDPSSRVLKDNYNAIVADAATRNFDIDTFYQSISITPTAEILRGFEYSLYLGA